MKMMSTILVQTLLKGKREKMQTLKTNVTSKDVINVKMDSGFLSDANLSCDMISKENIDEYESKNDTSNKYVTNNITLDSGLDIGESDCLSELDIDKKINLKSPNNNFNWLSHFEPNDDGETQLHLTILNGYVEASIMLIDMCQDSKYLNIRNDIGQTALHLAVLTNQCELVNYLLKAGANAEIIDCSGNTAVHLACYIGKLDILRILSNYVLLPKMLDAVNYDGLACIHIATIANHQNVVKFVVNNARNVNVTDYKSGYTALHFAVALNRATLIECLVDKVDPNVESYAGQLAFEVNDYEYDDDEEVDVEEEISLDLMNSINALQLSNNSIKC
ncbi:NF-kappa-B inhibitor cactus-like isoform X2 [Daktulosphaira vitifoliae]|uniref:NF-kappa-B inhibitor cactus-like isoform X2 n=1 Tax=Daktulosphaira vitifoliae TaxID=58002 RepID=UPI0021AB085D|nr:NF-kappa-B inhibitor cactus-like isoform X2 [Daktulosphaira vitifoliae]